MVILFLTVGNIVLTLGITQIAEAGDHLAYSPDGALIAAAWESKAGIWKVADGQRLHLLAGHSAEVWQVSLSPRGDQLVTGGDGTAKIWETKTGKLIRTLSPSPQLGFFVQQCPFVRGAQFSPDGKQVLIACAIPSGGGVFAFLQLWDSISGRLVASAFPRPCAQVFSSDGTQVLVGGCNGTITLLNRRLEPIQRKFKGHSQSISSIAISDDGRYAATAGTYPGLAKLWDVTTGEEIRSLDGYPKGVYSVALSSDGAQMLTGGTGPTVKLWDVKSGKAIGSFEHDGAHYIDSLKFSSDGRYILTLGQGDIVLWNRASGERIRSFPLF